MSAVYQVHPKKLRGFILSLNSKIILLNIVLFIIFSILIYSNAAFLDYVALNPRNIIQNQYLWTFLTSMFMHGGIFHLFVNMLSLFFVGGLIEKIIGPKRYLYFYLGSGLLAGLVFVLARMSENVPAVGASGAIFGLVGLLIMLTPNLPVYVMFIPIPIKIKYAGPGMLVALWLISATTGLGIGNWAHFGGLLAGVGYGVYLKYRYKNKTKRISKYFS